MTALANVAPSLTLYDVATAVNVSTDTIRRAIVVGALPAYKVGRQYRIRPDDFDAYVSAGRVRPCDQTPLVKTVFANSSAGYSW